MGRLDSLGERDRLDIAGDMIGEAIAPGPAARIFEHGEILAGQQFGDGLAVGVGPRPDEGLARAAAAHQRPGIMGRENLSGEADIGDVVAKGVDSRIERQRRPGQVEPLIRSEG